MSLSRRQTLGLLTGSLLAPALAACNDVLQKPFPEKRYFVLSAERPESQTTNGNRVLAVRRMRVGPGYDGRGLVTRGDALSAASDFYNEFFVAPGAMIEDLTGRWLSASGLFASVVATSSQLDPSHVLEGNLVALHGDYGPHPMAVLDVQWQVLDVRSARDSVLLQSDHRLRIPLKDRTPQTLVNGFNQALAQALGDFETSLRRRLVSGTS